ncbi:rhodanese-like domain-containing protein [Haloarchaeobius iranensis]|uniref:Rhodanese-related sulfurtransferase n=1 Tax=Haloarchaeobius iranensis TaxID=996166 RepID=A0A1G9UFF7_9EURY|nr:rhodanese-like domain-containing protein [Haloarchaeobius iranensis]SDM58553.1 Rhodanese-related sulfurtransferase [Haloarchaeobius iranensis]
MKRRALLGSGLVALGSLAGCLGEGDDPAGTDPTTGTAAPTEATSGTTDANTPEEIGGDGTASGGSPDSPRDVTANPGDPNPTDGFPPEPAEVPAEREVDTSSYRTIDVDGEQIQLAPIEDVHYWWARQEVRVADARGLSQYRESHILGAVASPVGAGIDDTHVGDWATDERIVCYCGCPHHLSSMRAAELQAAGYENVSVIDEGFFEWVDQSYPVVGSDASNRTLYRIQGRTRPGYAGEMVLARHVGSDRVEAAPVQRDGSYEVHVRFADVTPASRLQVETPDYTVTATLDELTSTVVTARLAGD